MNNWKRIRRGVKRTFVGILDVLGLATSLLDDAPPLGRLALLLLLQFLRSLLTQQQLKTKKWVSILLNVSML